ncbi:MAG: hypothetical protein QOJ59_1709 [Thermomicrobiales bacterium]|nr:hypothetical protein [Thermomicrobiales bacterium]
MLTALSDDPKVRRRHLNHRGAGAFTLCEDCNKKTGAWYVNHFAKWCYQGADVLVRSNFNPKLIYLHYILPLPVIKQLYVMVFSVNSARWREKHPELEQFVGDPRRRWLNPKYRAFVYYNVEGCYRNVGSGMAVLDLNRGNRVLQVTEISFPPFGYVVTWDGSCPDPQLCEITHFCRYDYDEFEVAPLYLPVLPTHENFPLDYRTRKQIDDQAADSKAKRLAAAR